MDELLPITMITAGLFLMWCAVKNRKPHKVMQAILTGGSWEDADPIAGDNPLGDIIPDLPGIPNLPGLPGVPDEIPLPGPIPDIPLHV